MLAAKAFDILEVFYDEKENYQACDRTLVFSLAAVVSSSAKNRVVTVQCIPPLARQKKAADNEVLHNPNAPLSQA